MHVCRSVGDYLCCVTLGGGRLHEGLNREPAAGECFWSGGLLHNICTHGRGADLTYGTHRLRMLDAWEGLCSSDT